MFGDQPRHQRYAQGQDSYMGLQSFSNHAVIRLIRLLIHKRINSCQSRNHRASYIGMHMPITTETSTHLMPTQGEPWPGHLDFFPTQHSKWTQCIPVLHHLRTQQTAPRSVFMVPEHSMVPYHICCHCHHVFILDLLALMYFQSVRWSRVIGICTRRMAVAIRLARCLSNHPK